MRTGAIEVRSSLTTTLDEALVGGWCQTCGLASHARLRGGGPLHQEPG